MWTSLLIAIIPAAVLFVLPARWALVWIALVWTAFLFIRFQVDLTDDPAFISFAMAFGFFIPVNVLATLARIALMVQDLTYASGDSYRDYEED